MATIHLPGIPYRCTLCGDCCREPWALRMDDPAILRLEAIDWGRCRSALPPASEAELFAEGRLRCYRQTGSRKTLPRTCTGCVFLEASQTCFLHRVFGPEMKPNACVEFPYAFVDTPGGVFVGLSFVCRAVREAVRRSAESGPEEKGGDAEEGRESWFPEVAESHRRSRLDPARRRSVADWVRLEERVPLTWEDYVQLEGGLLEVLGAPGRSLRERLVAGEVFLGLLADYLQAAAATEDAARRGEVIAHYLEAIADGQGERLFQIASKIRPNRQTRHLIATLFETFARRSAGSGAGAGLRSLWLGFAWLWDLGRRVVAAPRLPEPDAVEERILTTYALHVVWRKGLLAGASPYFTGVVRRGYAHLLITVALILETWGRGMADCPRREALLDAIRTVERDFVLHGAERSEVPVQELINRHRFPLHLLDALTHRRFFARSMLG